MPQGLKELGGAAILVDGKVVAWFADFDEAARDWCSFNHFGKWLVWAATTPEIIPLTPEEQADCDRRADEMLAKLRVV
jgi:hypothetical protein